jgi:hypothetical protein
VLAIEGRPAAAEIPRTSQTSNSDRVQATARLLATERDEMNIRYQENHQQQHQLINAKDSRTRV